MGWMRSDRLKPESLERVALCASVIAGIVAAIAGWLGEGIVALAAGLTAAALPFVQSHAANQILGKKFARRSFSAQAMAEMAKQLTQHAVLSANERQRVAIFPTSGQFESSALADQLADVFVAAGWQINRNTVHYGRPMHVNGVGVLAHRHPTSEAVAKLVVAVLQQQDILAFVIPERVQDSNLQPNADPADPFYSSISIMIGDKP
jgi:hypothetical protein